MTSDRSKTTSQVPAKHAHDQARAERLKQALRDNLRRRKGQTKLRKSNENNQDV